MTKKEFEERTGVCMTEDDFSTVHDIYIACGEMDKSEFCSLWKEGQTWEILNRVIEEKNNTERAYEKVMDGTKKLLDKQMAKDIELAEFLLGKANDYDDRDFYDEAVRLVGKKDVVMAKLRLDLPLWDEDKEYIKDNLK